MTKAPTIIVRKTGGGLAPVSAYDAEQLDTFPAKTEFDLKPRTRRSNQFNRLYWQTLANVREATSLGDRYPTSPKLHEALLWDLDYVTTTYELDGKPHLVRDSTAFDNMQPPEFKEYFDRAMMRLAEVVGFDPLAEREDAA